MSDSSTQPKTSKASTGKATRKPRQRNLPIWKHKGTRRWCRRGNLNGKVRVFYFGSIEGDPDGEAALRRHDREWQYLSRGLPVPPDDVGDYPTLKRLVNLFLAAKESKLEAGESTERMLRDYQRVCKMLLRNLGSTSRVDALRPLHFQKLRDALAKRLGPVSFGIEITRISWCYGSTRRTTSSTGA